MVFFWSQTKAPFIRAPHPHPPPPHTQKTHIQVRKRKLSEGLLKQILKINLLYVHVQNV